MKKIILTTTILLILSTLPGGCCLDSCCGESFDDPGQLNIIDLEMLFKNLSNNEEISNDEYLDYANAKFDIEVLEFDYISEIKNSSNNGFNLAYACSPPEAAPDIFLRYKVISNQNVHFGDSIIEAGSNLAEYFEYQGYHDNGRFFLDLYDDYFTLTYAPTDTIDQNFEFELEMEDGQIFNLLIEEVRIVPN